MAFPPPCQMTLPFVPMLGSPDPSGLVNAAVPHVGVAALQAPPLPCPLTLTGELRRLGISWQHRTSGRACMQVGLEPAAHCAAGKGLPEALQREPIEADRLASDLAADPCVRAALRTLAQPPHQQQRM